MTAADPDENLESYQETKGLRAGSWAGDVPVHVEKLVEIALNDIDTGYLGVRGALQMVAILAWREGRNAGK